MDNPKVRVGDAGARGRGVFAIDDIAAGELIACFDGPIYVGGRDGDAPNDPPDFVNDHAIQFEPNRLRDSKGIARVLNHSCEPNCGIRNLFDLVTMRPVTRGEELTWDYSMTEDSDWEFDCLCATPSCRGVVRGYRHLPREFRDRYRGYVSRWLLDDYRDP